MCLQIIGFRCGSVSLNLTVANRVILVDPWWNSALEAQAFGRVRRIGQEKRQHFVRILVRKTVDQRLINLQMKKKKECDIVMEGDNTAKTKDLTLNELASLFGAVQEGEDGTATVNEDYKELEEENIDEVVEENLSDIIPDVFGNYSDDDDNDHSDDGDDDDDDDDDNEGSNYGQDEDEDNRGNFGQEFEII